MNGNKAWRGIPSMIWLSLSLACAAASAQSTARASQAPQGWLSSAQVPRESVTEALRALSSMSEQEAARQIDTFRAARAGASEEGKRAADLIIGVAFERAGDMTGARIAYQSLVKDAAGTPYSSSASYRLRIVEQPNQNREELDKVYKTIADEPETEGWFLVSDQWTWTTSRQAALKALVDLRADYLSIRLFSFLRSKSIFPAPYAYLFIFLIIGIGVKILALPLHVKAARLIMQLRRLGPQIRSIQSAYSDDPTTMNQHLAELYKANGVNVWSGCLVSLIDLIFVIWALVTLSDFSSQMALDGAKFWWISDVLKRDFGILIAWTAATFIQSLTNARTQPQQVAQISCSVLISCGIFASIAWYWQWPAYVMVFWAVLTVLGLLTNLLLMPIASFFGSDSRQVSPYS